MTSTIEDRQKAIRDRLFKAIADVVEALPFSVSVTRFPGGYYVQPTVGYYLSAWNGTNEEWSEAYKQATSQNVALGCVLEALAATDDDYAVYVPEVGTRCYFHSIALGDLEPDYSY